MNRFEQYEQNYLKAVESIKEHIDTENCEEYEKDSALLCKFLFESDFNPYGLFVHETDAAKLHNSAQGFAGLCASIHHALVDDGDICFPVVDGSPKILFANRWEVSPDDCVDAHYKQVIDSRNEFFVRIGKPAKPITVEFLDNVKDFIGAVVRHEQDHKEQIDVLKTSLSQMKQQKQNTDNP
jgi:hypothetical protein